MVSSIILISSLATPIMGLQGVRLAKPAIQAITPRADFGGAWPLGLDGSGGHCPPVAPVSCEASGTSKGQCCGSGQTCAGSSITAYCCPSSTDCETFVKNFPVCVNTTWTMYEGPYGNFCCEPGQIAVNPSSGYFGLCVASDQVVAASLLATTVAQNTATAGTATGTGTSLTRTTGTGTGSSSPTDTAGNANTPTEKPSSKSGLGTGPIIGIVIGGLGLILLAGILWALIRRNKLRQTALGHPSHPPGPMYMPTPQPGVTELPPAVGRKPVPHMMATSMYSGATPGGSSPGAFSNPPLYSAGNTAGAGYEPPRSQTTSPSNAGVGRYDSVNSAGTQRYDPPTSASYENYHEMEGPGVTQRAELRADRTGN